MVKSYLESSRIKSDKANAEVIPVSMIFYHSPNETFLYLVSKSSFDCRLFLNFNCYYGL